MPNHGHGRGLDEDLHQRLIAAANHSSPCQRVLRHAEDREVYARPEDFHRALRRVDDLVVRLHFDAVEPCDVRYDETSLEWATRVLSASQLTRRKLIEDIRDATRVELQHHDHSWFTEQPPVDQDRVVLPDGGIDVVEDNYETLAPAAVDAVDLKHEGCPVCGTETFEEFPAGHYHCDGCGTHWTGDPTDASLAVYFGPSPDDLQEADESLPVDTEGRCSACLVHPSGEDSRFCAGCADELLATDGGQTAYEWVLEDAREHARAAVDGPWTSRDHLLQEGSKSTHGYSRDDIEDAISQALVANDLLEWNSLLVPATEDNLRAVIEAEQDAEITRRILVGKVNRYLAQLRNRDQTAADSAAAQRGDA